MAAIGVNQTSTAGAGTLSAPSPRPGQQTPQTPLPTNPGAANFSASIPPHVATPLSAGEVPPKQRQVAQNFQSHVQPPPPREVKQPRNLDPAQPQRPKHDFLQSTEVRKKDDPKATPGAGVSNNPPVALRSVATGTVPPTNLESFLSKQTNSATPVPVKVTATSVHESIGRLLEAAALGGDQALNDDSKAHIRDHLENILANADKSDEGRELRTYVNHLLKSLPERPASAAKPELGRLPNGKTIPEGSKAQWEVAGYAEATDKFRSSWGIVAGLISSLQNAPNRDETTKVIEGHLASIQAELNQLRELGTDDPVINEALSQLQNYQSYLQSELYQKTSEINSWESSVGKEAVALKRTLNQALYSPIEGKSALSQLINSQLHALKKSEAIQDKPSVYEFLLAQAKLAHSLWQASEILGSGSPDKASTASVNHKDFLADRSRLLRTIIPTLDKIEEGFEKIAHFTRIYPAVVNFSEEQRENNPNIPTPEQLKAAISNAKSQNETLINGLKQQLKDNPLKVKNANSPLKKQLNDLQSTNNKLTTAFNNVQKTADKEAVKAKKVAEKAEAETRKAKGQEVPPSQIKTDDDDDDDD